MESPGSADAHGKLVLVVERVFAFSAEQVFDAWLDPASMRQWLFKTPDGQMKRVECDPRVGGSFVVAEQRGEVLAEHFGTYLEIARPHRLVFGFASGREMEPSRVTIEITSADGGCSLRLTHEIDPQWTEYLDRVQAGWTMILNKLAHSLGASDRCSP